MRTEVGGDGALCTDTPASVQAWLGELEEGLKLGERRSPQRQAARRAAAPFRRSRSSGATGFGSFSCWQQRLFVALGRSALLGPGWPPPCSIRAAPAPAADGRLPILPLGSRDC